MNAPVRFSDGAFIITKTNGEVVNIDAFLAIRIVEIVNADPEKFAKIAKKQRDEENARFLESRERARVAFGEFDASTRINNARLLMALRNYRDDSI
jgi:hypothetical protein